LISVLHEVFDNNVLKFISKVVQSALFVLIYCVSDERGEMLAAPFLTLPSKRKLPQYYQRVTDPIDLCTLEQNIVTGFYRTVESFDRDMSRLFNNNVRFFGRTSELGISATRLRKAYNMAKMDFLAQIEDILGESPPASFIPEHDPGCCFVFTVVKLDGSLQVLEYMHYYVFFAQKCIK
jgi:histone-lysine N-methyltransferase ASH1L